MPVVGQQVCHISEQIDQGSARARAVDEADGHGKKSHLHIVLC